MTTSISTATENILSFDIKGETVIATVIATFTSEKTLNEYIGEFSPMQNDEKWHDVVGFTNFIKSENTIVGSSSYHSVDTIIEIFKAGLKL